MTTDKPLDFKGARSDFRGYGLMKNGTATPNMYHEWVCTYRAEILAALDLATNKETENSQ